ncbi:MAG: cation transporter [Patescibacteria group bacterium]
MIRLLSRTTTEHPLRMYAFVWFLSLGIVALEIVGSGESGSQALLADVGHVASDTLLALVPLSALVFMRMGVSKRAVALVSSLAAVALLLFIGYHVGSEAIMSLMGDAHHDHEVNGMLLFLFSGSAAILNLFQHRLLSRISPEHHHGAHKGLHFHVIMDLVKNIALPTLGLLIAFELIPDASDLWAALVIGALLIVRGLMLLYTTVTAKEDPACHAR